MCINRFPPDYKCSWNCDDWAGQGSDNKDTNYCNDNWTKYSHCAPTTDDLIKHSCKVSCGTCTGRLLMTKWLVLRFFIQNKTQLLVHERI